MSTRSRIRLYVKQEEGNKLPAGEPLRMGLFRSVYPLVRRHKAQQRAWVPIGYDQETGIT